MKTILTLKQWACICFTKWVSTNSLRIEDEHRISRCLNSILSETGAYSDQLYDQAMPHWRLWLIRRARRLVAILKQATAFCFGLSKVITLSTDAFSARDENYEFIIASLYGPGCNSSCSTGQSAFQSLSTWWRHQMETFSALLALCAGNSLVPVNSPHKGQWRGALMFSLICAWINDWVNNCETGDLRCHRGHYDVNVVINMLQRTRKRSITAP